MNVSQFDYELIDAIMCDGNLIAVAVRASNIRVCFKNLTVNSKKIIYKVDSRGTKIIFVQSYNLFRVK